VLSVEYRLAPEHPFPTPLDDAWAALQWAATSLADGSPLVVAGDSAGGALAAACALRARDRGGPALAAQLLVYPVLDADLDRPSYRACAAGLPLTAADMAWYWDLYLPDVAARRDPDASPLRVTDPTGLAPATIVAADVDPLRDEAVAHAGRLRRAGVPVALLVEPGVPHLYLTVPGLPARDRGVGLAGAALRRSLA